MKIEELKMLANSASGEDGPSVAASIELGEDLVAMRDEILALVEAANRLEFDYDNGWENVGEVKEALNEFYAKLETLL